MSCHWGFRCESCQVNSPTWFNHGLNTLDDIVTRWAVIKSIWKLPYIDLSFVEAYDFPGPADFLSQHDPETHKIVAFNKYGETEQICRPRRCQCPIENHNDVPSGRCLVCGGEA